MTFFRRLVNKGTDTREATGDSPREQSLTPRRLEMDDPRADEKLRASARRGISSRNPPAVAEDSCRNSRRTRTPFTSENQTPCCDVRATGAVVSADTESVFHSLRHSWPRLALGGPASADVACAIRWLSGTTGRSACELSVARQETGTLSRDCLSRAICFVRLIVPF